MIKYKCSKCQKLKGKSLFPLNKATKSGLANECKSCKNKRGKLRCSEKRQTEYLKNKDKILEQQRIKTYGINNEQLDYMRKEQNYRCRICKIHEEQSSGKGLLHIDHCHETGKIRGLLCSKCNIGLGQFNDDPNLLIIAQLYLLGE